MIVRTPSGVLTVWPTAVIAVPFIATMLGKFGEVIRIVPTIVSAGEAGSDPEGSEPRPANADSDTVAVAAMLPNGWSGVTIEISGSSSKAAGITSSSSTFANANSVEERRSPRINGSPISPGT